ncbi:glutathione synthetase-like [Chrysoperla carnea]|uniref:glutathione synthetase-like n=1 Tax=Chrysoperla carnea TaxID=189513 RepID=UPI001D06B57E|nr:glutathione synthetase-like [Chrysoperla carnea]
MSPVNTTFKNGTSILSNGIKLPSEKQILLEIIDKAKDWAITHGIGVRVNYDTELIKFISFMLLPSPFPRCEFQKAIDLQPVLNELLHNVAHDYEFLKDSLKNTIKADEFTRNLFEIYEIVHKEGTAQDISLGIFRSDYLLDFGSGSHIKQVETNTIAIGFATIGQKTYDLHKYMLTELGYNEKLINLPENNSLTETTLGLIKAWEIYNNKKSVILFVISEPALNNVCDVRFHEYEINKLNRNLKLIRRTLTQIANTVKLGPNKQLLVDDFEIAVVYYRTGFMPEQYNSKREWDARLLMERSLAIKCPSIQYQLVGTKKIQQVLAQPNVLEKFIKSPKTIKSVRETFTGLYSLDFDEYGEQAVNMALENPGKYVLKSQRDGGGNNVFGENISDVLLRIKYSKNRAAWILMDKISSPISQGYMIRYDKVQKMNFVSELGIFGVILGNSNKIFYNKEAGHLLRSKLSTADEAGCLKGNGATDSSYLIDYIEI